MAFRGSAAILVTVSLLFAPVSCATAPTGSRDDSTTGYAPPREPEQPVLAAVELRLSPEAGITIGAIGVVAGMIVSASGVTRAFGSAEDGFHAPPVQSGIILSGSGVIGSALSAILIDRSRSRVSRE